ncbi:hypothetical protein EST38_g8661 [Candolleomyces aberdarensis]|uniref:Uncharacterized protein n=1 Tax=Candolleomyces aberdarensis TaxID=2316362 RepID=A0A4Q2DDQ5_9AGAR|nr:hypothetical protein EST38_g8661 [Candolleomyces aberdarensis]
MAPPTDIFALYHATVAKLKDWTPGVPPPMLPKPGLFIGKVLDLILAMNRPKNADILQYPGAQALNCWVGAVLNKTSVTLPSSLSAEEDQIIKDLPGNTFPSLLPAHSTVPLTLKDHLDRQPKPADLKQKGKSHQREDTPSLQIYSLTGLPTNEYCD